MPLVAAVPARTDRSRLARHRAGQSLPAAHPAVALRAVLVLSAPIGTLGTAYAAAVPLDLRGLFRGRRRDRGRRPAPAAQSACNHLRPRDGRRRRDQPAAVRQRRRRQRPRHPVRRAGRAPWPCWPTVAMHSCWRRSRRSRCSPSRSPAHLLGTAQTVRLSSHRHPRRHRVPGGAARLADRAPPARHRSHGAAPAGGPRQSRAAVAVHRAAPARKHRGGRPRKPHPAHQRIRGASCSATAAPIRARCSAKLRRNCSIYSRPGGSAPRAPRRPRRPSSRPTAAT